MSFKRELDSIFFRRQDEQIQSYDRRKMLDEAAEVRRLGVHSKDPEGKFLDALKENGLKHRTERQKHDDMIRKMFQEGASDQEIADRLRVGVQTIQHQRVRLGMRRKKRK